MTNLDQEYTEEEIKRPPENWSPLVSQMRHINELPTYFYQPDLGVIPMPPKGVVPPNLRQDMVGNAYPDDPSLR